MTTRTLLTLTALLFIAACKQPENVEELQSENGTIRVDTSLRYSYNTDSVSAGTFPFTIERSSDVVSLKAKPDEWSTDTIHKYRNLAIDQMNKAAFEFEVNNRMLSETKQKRFNDSLDKYALEYRVEEGVLKIWNSKLTKRGVTVHKDGSLSVITNNPIVKPKK